MHEIAGNAWIIAKREFGAYFATPLAPVFLTVFVALTGAFTFYIGNFFDRGQADLLLVPAVAMRLWAEERKSGTIELLMTLPIQPVEAMLGKFAAAWGFIGLALLLTIPMWITVNVLGDPDNGIIVAGYLGSLLTAGAFLAIGAFVSALTKNQVIAFIVAAMICFLFTMSGLELVQNTLQAWTPEIVASTIASMSFMSHFERISKGVLDVPTLVFFVSMIVFWLFASVVAIGQTKAQ